MTVPYKNPKKTIQPTKNKRSNQRSWKRVTGLMEPLQRIGATLSTHFTPLLQMELPIDLLIHRVYFTKRNGCVIRELCTYYNNHRKHKMGVV